MTRDEAQKVVELFIGRFRLRMNRAASAVSYIEMADVVEALAALIEYKKDK